jgi:TrmH family RNA methyltransferase
MQEQLVILDGFHAVKHALRFGADVVDVMALPGSDWRVVARELAPDVLDELERRVREAPVSEFRQYSPQQHPTGIVALALRPVYKVAPEQDGARRAPAVLLENPRRLGNVGAVVRVAAAAGASGVTVLGDMDPWHPAAIRGSAGLHFALPVTSGESLDQLAGPVVVLDPEGEPINQAEMPAGSLLVFGTERQGVSEELKRRADLKLALPMQPGVSSLNLATSVAATLYYWRLSSSSSSSSLGS